MVSTRQMAINPSTSGYDDRQIGLLDLPTEILEKIFIHSGFKTVATMRGVSRRTNLICSSILNSTFSNLLHQLTDRFQAVKALMPRRESARRHHELASEYDIIETVHMRMSLLQMTFGKHIERKNICFFPGAILDEVYNILEYIKITPYIERPFRIIDEMFDLSTMALEHFKDHIEPILPEIVYFSNLNFSSIKNPRRKSYMHEASTSRRSASPPQSNMVLRKGIRKIKQGMKRYNDQLSVIRTELKTCKRKMMDQSKLISEQQKVFNDMQKQMLEYANRSDETSKKHEEMSRKFSTLLQELNKCKTELQYWRAKGSTCPPCRVCDHNDMAEVANGLEGPVNSNNALEIHVASNQVISPQVSPTNTNKKRRISEISNVDQIGKH